MPALVSALPALDPRGRSVIRGHLAGRLFVLEHEPTTQGWPAWNLAREQARSALDSVRSELVPLIP